MPSIVGNLIMGGIVLVIAGNKCDLEAQRVVLARSRHA